MKALRYLSLLALCLSSCVEASKETVREQAQASHIIRTGQIIATAYSSPVMSRPDDGSTRMAELSGHTTVRLTDHEEKGWTLVEYGQEKETGFVQTDHITPAKFSHPARIKGKWVDMKVNPDAYQETVKTLTSADSVDCLSNFDEKWVHVCTHDGTLGFVETNHLTKKQ